MRSHFWALAIGLSIACSVDKPIEMEEENKVINGVELYTKVVGDGEPILVLHGGPGLDQSYFFPQMTELAREFKLIFFDQRLSGKSASDLDSTQVSLQLFIDDIEAIRQEFDLGRMHLLGHSWGGLLAMYYAIAYPENLASLMLINATPASAELAAKGGQRARQRTTREDSLAKAKITQTDAFKRGDSAAYEAFFRLNFGQTFYDRSLIDSLTLTLPEHFVENMRRLAYLYKDMEAYDLHADLARITCPTLILTGDNDDNPVEAYEKIASHIKDSQFTVLSNCGHFPFIEAKAEFFRRISDFVNAN